MASSKTAGRVLLPPTINPIRYDLKFTPDLENFTFSGETTIEVTTSADVGNDITMHAKELCFATASYAVKGESGEEVHEVEEIRANMKATTVTFVFGGVLPANASLILKIEVSVNIRLLSCRCISSFSVP